MPHHDAFGLTMPELDIAIVENSRAMQTTLRSMLANFGVRRIRAYDTGPEALTAMLADPPCVVITSWLMAPMSGARLITTMRDPEFPSLCTIPVITATAHATLSVVDAAFSAGSTALLAKPLSSAALRNRLEWLIRDSREMVEEDGRIVIEGMEDVLETRVRNSPLANAIMRATALEAVMRGEMEAAGEPAVGKSRVGTEAELCADEEKMDAEARVAKRLRGMVKPEKTATQGKSGKTAKRARRWYGWEIDKPKGSTAA